MLSLGSSTTTRMGHVNTACRVTKRLAGRTFVKEIADDLISRCVVMKNLPLSILDDPDTHKIFEYVCPGYKPPGTKTLVSKFLPKMEEKTEAVIREKLQDIDALSVSMDGGTSTAKRKYVAVTCSGINRITWQSELFLIGYMRVSEGETAEFLDCVVRTLLDYWKIPVEKVVAVTTDKGSNMVCCVTKHLKLPWVHCTAHMLHLSVMKALKPNQVIKELLEKASEVCKLFGSRRRNANSRRSNN